MSDDQKKLELESREFGPEKSPSGSVVTSTASRRFTEWLLGSWRSILSVVVCLLVLVFMVWGVRQQVDYRLLTLVVSFSFIFPVIAFAYHNNRSRHLLKVQEFDRLQHAGNRFASHQTDSTPADLQARYQSEYGNTPYTLCLIPAVAVALIGWTLVLVPLDGISANVAGIGGGEQSDSAALFEPYIARVDEAKGKVETAAANVKAAKEDAVVVTETESGKKPATLKEAQKELATAEANLALAEKANQAIQSRPLFSHLKPVVSQAMAIGFLGAFVFCGQLLWQRITTEDLKPTIFLRCAFAMFCGMTFNLVVFSAVDSFASGLPGMAKDAKMEGMAGTEALVGYIVAFSLGYFPTLAIQWFTRIAHNSLGESSRRSDSQRLSLVDGITLFHEERLLEEGVQTLHDLAFCDVGQLLVKTPYTSHQLLDWVDQSFLFLILKAEEVDSFRRAGVRTSIDLLAAWKPYHSPAASDPTAAISSDEVRRSTAASAFQSTPQRLDAIYLAITNSFSQIS